MNREEWLQAGVKELGYIFDRHNIDIPMVNVSCSWPGGGSPNKRIGECWARSGSAADINEVFISPTIDNAVEALAILAHELIHAVDNCAHGHRGPFVKMMKAIGLEGKPTATHAGAQLTEELTEIVELIGEYPHQKVSVPAPKQKSRQLKASCYECGAVWRMSSKWLELATTCPCCQSEEITID